MDIFLPILFIFGICLSVLACFAAIDLASKVSNGLFSFILMVLFFVLAMGAVLGGIMGFHHFFS